jgi:hypothetical protein
LRRGAREMTQVNFRFCVAPQGARDHSQRPG